MSKNIKLLVGFLILVVIALVGFLAYDLGTKSANPAQNTNTAQNTPAPVASQSPTSEPTFSPAPNTQTVTAGGILVFAKYSLNIPSGWTSNKEVTQYSDMVTLTKEGYKITIYQAAGGGGGCVYPGQPPQEMAQTFTSFAEITDPNGFVFRRGPSEGTPNSWTVCQRNATDGSFGFPTNFGNITFTTPASPSNLTMAEIDGILASLKKQ